MEARDPAGVPLIRMSETVARIISHDLKNPLAGIAGALQMLREGEDPGVPQYVLLGEVRARVAYLTRILDDLVALGRTPELVPSPVSLGPFARDVIGNLVREREWSGVEVLLDGDDVTVETDADYLERALGHLAVNAVEAMQGRPQAHVRVTVRAQPARADGAWCSLTVSDRGGGIPEGMAERIFEPRFTTKPAHAGLGLSVVRHLVEHLGGDVRAGPSEEGGAAFTLHLPLG